MQTQSLAIYPAISNFKSSNLEWEYSDTSSAELFRNYVLIENDGQLAPDLPAFKPQNAYQSKAKAFINSTFQMVWAKEIKLPSPEINESHDLRQIRDILKNPSSILDGRIIHAFHESINQRRLKKGLLPVKEINCFYRFKGFNFDRLTLEDAISHLNCYSANWNKESSISIPIFLSGYRGHIVTILIKNNLVEYYDPDMISSKMRPLAGDGETLHDFLKYCVKKFTNRNQISENIEVKDQISETVDPIRETPIKLQNDNHNCGVFCCEFLERRTINDEDVGTQPLYISFDHLAKMREYIFCKIKELHLSENTPKAYQNPENEILAVSDFFDLEV